MSIRFCLLIASLYVVSGVSDAVTADELVAKYIEARGGAEKMKAIQTLRLTGKLAIERGVHR